MKIRIKYRKLGKVWGLAHSDGLIEIDERAKGKKHLELIIHETLHLLFPQADEQEIVEKSVTLTKLLWKENYRRIDPHEDIPLQDGTK